VFQVNDCQGRFEVREIVSMGRYLQRAENERTQITVGIIHREEILKGRKQLNGILSGGDKFRLGGWDLHSYSLLLSAMTALCPAGREMTASLIRVPVFLNF
jgi:hypothetical protein